MPAIDENLRHRHSAARTLDHFLTFFAAHADIRFFKTDIFTLQQGLGAEAEATGKFGIYFNFSHIIFSLA